ncbi:hypothetical protein BpHYR1_024881 [Brachionus plicatilis]|uniref:Uncharacterized protein n=1 Tax=Brachionus plicatilis TaxID=10195 RepID=A0A3M7PGA4_BRAPC|nr:hypothetical protein BpHYR1_024881 [Brachionus plicatilis]
MLVNLELKWSIFSNQIFTWSSIALANILAELSYSFKMLFYIITTRITSRARSCGKFCEQINAAVPLDRFVYSRQIRLPLSNFCPSGSMSLTSKISSNTWKYFFLCEKNLIIESECCQLSCLLINGHINVIQEFDQILNIINIFYYSFIYT